MAIDLEAMGIGGKSGIFQVLPLDFFKKRLSIASPVHEILIPPIWNLLGIKNHS